MKLTPVINFINILGAAFVHLFFCKNLESQTVIREKLRRALLHKKVIPKTLMKLTPEITRL